jgi:Putative lactococcus lactis phage r1t holin
VRAYLLNALDRLARTAVQCAAGYVLAGRAIGGVDWRVVGLATAMSVALCGLQCFVDFPALPWGWWGDVLGRAVRTFAQSAAGGAGAAVLITQVHWGAVLSAAGVAALSSVVTSVIATPFGGPVVKGSPALVTYPHWRMSRGYGRLRVAA